MQQYQSAEQLAGHVCDLQLSEVVAFGRFRKRTAFHVLHHDLQLHS